MVQYGGNSWRFECHNNFSETPMRKIILAATAAALLTAAGAASSQMPAPADMIKTWDKNGDGAVSRDEWAPGRQHHRRRTGSRHGSHASAQRRLIGLKRVNILDETLSALGTPSVRWRSINGNGRRWR
eukprot:gene43406-58790_t